MRRNLALFGVLLLACSEGERDGASTIFGSGAVSMSAEGSDMSTETSASSADDDTTSSSTNGNTTDSADTADPTTDTDDPTTDTDDPTTDTDDPTTDTDDPTGDPACGNGQIDQGEECDGNNLGGQSCVDFGFDGGVLGCDAIVCVYDTSGCTEEPSNECDQYCNGCACPSFECSMCCANKGLVDACGGGQCSCF